MLSTLLKFTAGAGLVYYTYHFVRSPSVKNPIVHGASSSAEHDAVDVAEEASMDSFPASDAPARNVFN